MNESGLSNLNLVAVNGAVAMVGYSMAVRKRGIDFIVTANTPEELVVLSLILTMEFPGPPERFIRPTQTFAREDDEWTDAAAMALASAGSPGAQEG